jgi:hypothetical protein
MAHSLLVLTVVILGVLIYGIVRYPDQWGFPLEVPLLLAAFSTFRHYRHAHRWR